MTGLRVTVDARPLDVDFLRTQGIGRLTHALLHELVPLAAERGGHLVLLREGEGSPYGPLPAGTREMRLRRPRVPGRLADLPEQVLLPADLRRLAPDAHHFLAPYRAALRPGVPSLMTFYDAIPLMFPEQYLRTGLMHRLLYAAARRADRLLAISATAARDAVEHLGVPEERVAVVPLAADARFRPVEPGDVPARLGVEGPYVLCVGGLANEDPRKRFGELVEAFGTWAREAGRAETLVMGGRLGPAGEAVRARADAAGARVRFAGFVPDDDLPALYAGARCLVSATAYEGFFLPGLEALACGTPVAAFGVGALPEVVGPGARLVADADFSALMRAVGELCDDDELRGRLAEAGRRHAAGYSWRRTAELTWEAYESVSKVPRRSTVWTRRREQRSGPGRSGSSR